SAGLIHSLPIWSAIVDLRLPVPQTAWAVVTLALAAALLLAGCYIAAVWISLRTPVSTPVVAVVLGAMALFSLISILSLPNTGGDLYLYMLYARVIDVHHASPFTVPPAAFAADPYLPYAPPAWIYTTSIYGPVWTILSALSGRM